MLCARCRAALSGAAPRRVRPEPEPAGLPVTHAAARYADEVRAALLAHKERGALALTRPLGEALAGAVRAGLREAARPGSGGLVGPVHGDRGAVLLVPVPSAPRAVRARGHDPALRIARAAAGVLRRQGYPLLYFPRCGSGGAWPTSRNSTPGSGWPISPARWRWHRAAAGCCCAVGRSSSWTI